MSVAATPPAFTAPMTRCIWRDAAPSAPFAVGRVAETPSVSRAASLATSAELWPLTVTLRRRSALCAPATAGAATVSSSERASRRGTDSIDGPPGRDGANIRPRPAGPGSPVTGRRRSGLGGGDLRRAPRARQPARQLVGEAVDRDA